MSDVGYSIGMHRGKFCLVYYVNGERKRRSLGTTEKSAAERLAPEFYAELTRGGGKTVADLWASYTVHMEGRNIIDRLGHSWKALRYRFAHIPGDEVTENDCRAHIKDRRAKGIKDGTLHTELGHLRMVLNWAAKRKLISYAPPILRPAKPLPKADHLTKLQAAKLLRACTLPHVRLFCLLALSTGSRTVSLLDLKWDRVDFKRGQINLRNPEIMVPHKGRAIVPMTDTVRAALIEARKGALSDHVIEWGGKPVKSVKKGVAAAARRAKLPHVSPHMLRHSAAVHMAEAGVDMEEIAQFLGHDDVRVTRKVYARFSPDHLKKAASALEYEGLDSDSSGTDEPEGDA